MIQDCEKLKEKGIRIRIIGDTAHLPLGLQRKFAEVMICTKMNKKLIINLAFAYTSRNEITSSMCKIIDGISNGHLYSPDIVSDALIKECLYVGDVDLLIRTSGETRLSDFLLWQMPSSRNACMWVMLIFSYALPEKPDLVIFFYGNAMSWVRETKLPWWQRLAMRVVKVGKVPEHIAFIMDGNRRFARKIHVEKAEGHSRGFEKLSEVLQWCLDLGVKEVTVYAFSIENFKRSEDEVDALMKLASEKFDKIMEEEEKLNENGVCIRIIGNMGMLPEYLQRKIARAMYITRLNSKAILNVAFAYTSRDEITHSVRTITEGVSDSILDQEIITDDLVNRCLHTKYCSDPDLLIRTSGETRLSDFLLWQVSSTILYFTKTLWPEITIWHVLGAIFQYQRHYYQMQTPQKILRMPMEADLATSTTAAKSTHYEQIEHFAILNVAFAYTSRDEITHSVRTITEGVSDSILDQEIITDDLVNRCLHTKYCSDPDLLIRTSGETRLSDFLLWQVSSTILYFTKTLWPEITIWHVLGAIFQYQRHYYQMQTPQKLLRMPMEADLATTTAAKSTHHEQIEHFVSDVDSRHWKHMQELIGQTNASRVRDDNSTELNHNL
uniref:ditrans,polycis-polyprenyl diphosphate synthase [(2E,6E)-farnesyldiphosphate specific] n=1 Tax=Lutzomyia longipalpis TaxID=7200 RepID=A0A1B0GHI0_LUTLO